MGGRVDRAIDTESELPGFDAIMRTQMGEPEQGLQMLKEYVATHRVHFFLVGGNTHWWCRPLQALSGLQTMKANARSPASERRTQGPPVLYFREQKLLIQ